MKYAKIAGVGGYLPPQVVENDELGRRVNTTDDWIKSRTGILRRHIAASGECSSDLALPAAKQALEAADMSGEDIDMIIVATTTPDRIYPATACLLQHKLNAAPCAAFDVQAVCSGFLYAFSIGDSMISAGSADNVLVVGAEVFSGILDWDDRSTCVLFGDGAGAVVLRSSDTPGVLATDIHANGKYADYLTVNAQVRDGKVIGDPFTRMDGGMVYRFAVTKMVESAQRVIDKSGRRPDWLVLHQANSRIIEAARARLGVAPDRCVNCVGECANTSAASVPLALAKTSHLFSAGDIILIAAAGGGFTWGAALVEW